MPASVSNASLQRDLASRLERVAQDISEIKAMFAQLEKRIRELETQEAGAHPVLEARIDGAAREIKAHEEKLERLTSIVLRLEHSNRIMTWLASILGSTVLVWVITQLLGLIP